MTIDQQSTGRTLRRFRGGLRVAAVGSALCLAAGMGLSMATGASAASRLPHPPGPHGHGGVLPVCISFGGILRLALPFSTCNGPIVPLEIAGSHPMPPPPPPPPSGIDTDVHSRSSNGLFDTVTAQCDPGEVATGGGFNASILGSFLLNTNEPTDNNGNPVGPGVAPTAWTVGFTLLPGVTGGILHPTYTAYVVCTDGPHFHHAPMAPAHAAARH